MKFHHRHTIVYTKQPYHNARCCGLSFLLCFLFALNLYAQRPKVGLVLGGGGAKGASMVGVLKEIERSGIPIDYIAGTSIGAVVGGLYAVGYRADDLDSLFRTQSWLALFTSREDSKRNKLYAEENGIAYVFGFPVRNTTINKKPQPGFGVLSGKRISNTMDSLIYKHPKSILYAQQSELSSDENTLSMKSNKAIPFACVAYDIRHQKEIVLRGGNIVESIRASMAIPAAFKPVEMGTALLVDGGMINNLPVDVVKQMGADIVIVIDLTQRNQDLAAASVPFLKGFGGLLDWLAERPDVKKYKANKAQADIYINPKMPQYGVSNFGEKAIAEMIAVGQQAGKEQYAKLVALKEKIEKGENHIKNNEKED